MGLPVVATDVRGCREVVDDGVTGVLVPVGDAAALAAALRALEETGRATRSRRRRPHAGPASTSTSAGWSTPCSTRTGRVARQKGLALPGL